VRAFVGVVVCVAGGWASVGRCTTSRRPDLRVFFFFSFLVTDSVEGGLHVAGQLPDGATGYGAHTHSSREPKDKRREGGHATNKASLGLGCMRQECLNAVGHLSWGDIYELNGDSYEG
jgi:hypothetical protein